MVGEARALRQVFLGHHVFALEQSGLAHAGLRVGAIDLQVANSPAFRVGAPVRLAMRPEAVRTRSITEATPNRFEARVGPLSFLGSFCRAQLLPTHSPGTPIAVDFSANAMRDLDIAEGQVRDVALPAETLRAFPMAATP